MSNFIPVSLVLLLSMPPLFAQTDADVQPVKQQTQITISRETTFLTEPLTEDGYVDYIAALNQQFSDGVTVDNNATVPFLRIFGPREISPDARKQFFSMLGIPELPAEGDYFETVNEYLKQQPGFAADSPEGRKRISEVIEEYVEATTRPWSRIDYPEVADWLQAHEKQIQQIREMTRRPRMYSPLIASADGDTPPMVVMVLLPVAQQTRESARILLAHTMLQLKAGKTAEAQQNVLACHRLARLAGQGSTIIDALVAIAIESMACAGDALIAAQGNLTVKQAAEFQADLRKLPAMPKMIDKLNTERFMYLDSATAIARFGPEQMDVMGGGNDMERFATKLLTSALIEWDEVLKSGNELYDIMVQAAKKETRAGRLKAFGEFEEDLSRKSNRMRKTLGSPLGIAKTVFLSRKTRGQLMGDILSTLLLPALTHAFEAEDGGATRLQMSQLAYALAGYKADHGRYPKNLAQLAPQYIPKVPVDLYSSRAFRYVADAEDFVLYSVGTNGKDDSGQSFDSDPPGDDIVIDTRPKEQSKR